MNSQANFIRVLATLGVVLIHASMYDFDFLIKSNIFDLVIFHLLEIIIRCSVPLFVLLSGYLILNKEIEEIYIIKEVISRVCRVAIPLYCWSIIIQLYISHYTGEKINLFQPFYFSGMFHLWYVYMIIGVYLLLPILRIIFTRINNTILYYTIIVWIFSNLITNYFNMNIVALLKLNNFLSYSLLFVIGGLISKLNGKFNIIKAFLLYLIFIVLIISTAVYSSLDGNFERIQAIYEPLTLHIVITSVLIFYILINIKLSLKNSCIDKILCSLSDKTFIVYFIHPIILEKIRFYTISLQLHPIIHILYSGLLTMICCVIVAYIIRLIPKSKTIFG